MIYLINSPILTNDGDYSIRTISVDDAKALLADKDFTSAVGHQSTADVMKTLLGVDIPVQRIQVAQAVGDVCLVFQLFGRPDIGADLSVKDIYQMGFALKLLTRQA